MRRTRREAREDGTTLREWIRFNFIRIYNAYTHTLNLFRTLCSFISTHIRCLHMIVVASPPYFYHFHFCSVQLSFGAWTMSHVTSYCSRVVWWWRRRWMDGGYESFEWVHKKPLMFPDNEQTSSNTINLCIHKKLCCVCVCLMFVMEHSVRLTCRLQSV